MKDGGTGSRRHKRVKATCRVRVVLENFEDFLTRYTNNLSEGGVFIQTADPRPLGTPLKLEISLRGGQQLLETYGEVAWTRKLDPDQPWRIPGMGIRFTKMNKTSRKQLQALLQDGLDQFQEVTIAEESGPVNIVAGSGKTSMAIDVGCAGVRVGLLKSDELTRLLNERPVTGEEMPWSEDDPYPSAARLISRALKKAEAGVNWAVVCTAGWTGTRGRERASMAVRNTGLAVKRVIGSAPASVVGRYAGRDLARKVLVYHLGASGFETALVDVQGDVFEVKAVSSDMAISGWAIDERIVQYLREYTKKRKSMNLDLEDPDVVGRLWGAAEEAKRRLSKTANADISLLDLKHGEHTRSVDLTARITRDVLSSLVKDLVDRSLQLCDDVLSSSGYDISSIEEVLLVGGQSRTQAVGEAVSSFFAKAPVPAAQEPELAAILGAGKVASALNRTDALVLVDCIPVSIGWQRPKGGYELLLPRGTKIPRAVHRQTETWKQDQERLRIHVFEGEGQSARENNHIGTWSITSIQPGAPARWRFAVRFEVDSSGLLNVSAVNQATGKRHHVVREIGTSKEDALADLELD
ncbi:MAG: TIGR02266 family protein [Deltaproteobacteria bacterium]|nr:TIGR02266 family protein [Deltaproteobacteria bacterium]